MPTRGSEDQSKSLAKPRPLPSVCVIQMHVFAAKMVLLFAHACNPTDQCLPNFSPRNTAERKDRSRQVVCHTLGKGGARDKVFTSPVKAAPCRT